MATTPLKTLSVASSSLVKNVLSTTPNLLAVSPKNLLKTPITKKKSARCLEFSSKSPRKNDRSLKIVNEKNSKSPLTEQTGNFFLNTPYKSELMKNGLSGKKRVSILGKGSFGTVIKGIYENKLAAAKIVMLRNSRRLNEVNSKNFSHENIVQTFEINLKSEAKYAVIIMEYLENFEELQSILERNENDLTDKTKRKIIKDICKGLQYCHDKGVLHLDIKPKNLLIVNGDHCKICDFGNSYNLFEDVENYEFKGTIAYAAPELLKGEKPSLKCDIYSLGITIWQMEYKEVPYEEWGSPECVLYKVVKFGARPKFTNLQNDIFTKIFRMCWREDPICRPDLKELQEKL